MWPLPSLQIVQIPTVSSSLALARLAMNAGFVARDEDVNNGVEPSSKKPRVDGRSSQDGGDPVGSEAAASEKEISGVSEPKDDGQKDCDVEFSVEADAAEDKGSRHTMEDAWVVLLDDRESAENLRCLHFAIYDGHGGRLAADFAKNHLHQNVLSAGLPRELMDLKMAKKAILEGFRKTDEQLLRESSAGGWHDGATAVCVWILGKTAIVANIGDAKAVLARSSVGDGSPSGQARASINLKAVLITREHKAIYPQERARIQKAGGCISNGRLQGRLEVSRAFGDRQFKKAGVIATPDVQSFDITEKEQFMILGCDGLWGVFGPSDAIEFVGKLLKEGLSATAVSNHLVREAVRERRCKDNCTAMVIIFRRK